MGYKINLEDDNVYTAMNILKSIQLYILNIRTAHCVEYISQ